MTGILSFDNEAKALNLCDYRATLIAKNLANSNTPGFKAQDINFSEVMQKAKGHLALQGSNAQHIQTGPSASGSQLYYRVPMQTKMDNNTVDDEVERKNFIENALRYQAGVSFVEKKSSQIIKALRGE